MKTKTTIHAMCSVRDGDDDKGLPAYALEEHTWLVRGLVSDIGEDVPWAVDLVEASCCDCHLPVVLEGPTLARAEEALIARQSALDAGRDFIAKLKSAGFDAFSVQRASNLVEDMGRSP